MAYFLKVSHLKKGDYLQIYDSMHDKEKKHSVHESYKALGYLDDLIASGIDDPISFYKAEVDKIKFISASKAKRKEYGDASKYVTFTPIDSNGEVDDETIVVASLNTEKIEKDLSLCGYNLIISSEIKMKPIEIYRIYHRLWRIEETFRILKSELDARPVYCHKQNTIYGHFLICYLSVFLLRILQIKKFKDKIHTNNIIDFIRSFIVLKEKDRIINLSSKDNILPLSNVLNLNIDNYVFKPNDVEKLLNLKI